jgi:hypothetical protein
MNTIRKTYLGEWLLVSRSPESKKNSRIITPNLGNMSALLSVNSNSARLHNVVHILLFQAANILVIIY